jgi:RNA-directed DNA polymerase
MQGVILYVEEKLLLKVNREKSKVRRPDEGIGLGFSFRIFKGKWIIRVAKRSEGRIKQ